MKQFVLAITGPAGAGKSTIGEKVAKSLERCVNIDADNIKHMIVGGFFVDKDMPGGGGYNRWDLAGDSIGLLAANFIKESYSVVINGYIDEPGWSNIQKHVAIDKKVLLLPELDTVISRDAGRNEDISMGEASVKQHHETFSTDDFYKDFERVDSTNHTAEDTVEQILSLVQ